MDPNSIKVGAAAAGASGSEPVYLEDVFSIDGYHGDGYHVANNSGGSTNRAIVNGLDLTGTGDNQGGMVWIKGSSDEIPVIGTTQLGEVSSGHWYNLATSNSDAKDHERPNGFKSFNNNGFNIGQDGHWNSHTKEYVSYTFKKQKGFFDIQTWDGNGTDGRTISHNLGGVPGAILVKCTSHDSTDWWMYHRGTYDSTPETYFTHFTATDKEAVGYLNSVAPTSSVITLGNDDEVNASGKSYIAFIFAHDDARFGTNEDQSIIKCGYYTGNGSSKEIWDLGWQPAFVLIKNVDSDEPWNLFDTMRGMPGTDRESILVEPNSQAVPASGDYCNIGIVNGHSRGFKIRSGSSRLNQSNKRHIYIAIAGQNGRNMRPVTDPSKVFAIDLDGTDNGTPSWVSGFPVDFQFIRDRAGTTYQWYISARLNGKNYFSTTSDANSTANSVYNHQYSNGWGEFGSASNITSWMWRKHAGFDVQWYNGNQTGRTIQHDLGQVPHMIWTKGVHHSSGTNTSWAIYSKDFVVGSSDPEDVVCRWDYNVAYDQAQWNDTAPTSEVFSVGPHGQTNGNNTRFLAMLFSSVDGICKCGGYSGSTSTVTVTTGFAPKFILILCYTDNGVEPFVFDTARGLTAGVDCYIQFNSSVAQDCNYDVIDIVTSPDGFSIPTTGSINNDGEKYIYYAHA